MSGMKLFLTGGARSGKSAFALKIAEERSGKRFFIATAEPLDNEMAERIEKHKAERSEEWNCIEEPIELALILNTLNEQGNVVLVDCLGLWVSNTLTLDDDNFGKKVEELTEEIKSFKGSLALVSNEVGLGIVPAEPESRKFRDRLGLLNREVASVCRHAVLVVSGIPLWLKGDPDRLTGL
jgi:adenosylcobinamide kinase/adenosylcobinamide-phosphate guanylyltransferase